MRKDRKASLVLCAATAVTSSLLTGRHSLAQVVDFEADTFTTGSNWVSSVPINSSTGALVATSVGTNTLVPTGASPFGPHAAVNLTGAGFFVPSNINTPPGGTTTYTIASVFDPTSTRITGNGEYQGATIYGFDIAGAGTPDTAVTYGGSSGQSILAGLGTVGGDVGLVSRALTLNTPHSVVLQVVDPNGTAGVGTATLWIDGNFVTEATGLTVAPINPGAGGSFGVGGQFTTTFPGLLGNVQVYDDASQNGATLSNNLLNNYGGSSIAVKTYNFSSGSGSYGTSTSFSPSFAASNVNNYNFSDARISNSGTAQLATGTFGILDLFVGDQGYGTSAGNFNQTGGTLNITNSFYLGRNNATGTYNLSAGTIAFSGPQNFELVGNTTTPAVFNVFGTGNLSSNSASGSIIVGEGTINASGGAIAASAILNISGTGIVNTGISSLIVGDNTVGSLGVVNISSGSLTVGNTLAIGRLSGTGIVNLSGTGTITKTNGSGGTVNIGGGNGTGTFNQTGGTFNNTTTGTDVGESAASATRGASNGTWNFTGGNANLQSLNVGVGGTGVVNLSGTYNLVATTVTVGVNNGASGTLNVAAGTPTITTLNIGSTGTGTVNVTNTGVLNVTTVNVGSNAGGNGIFNLSAGSSTVGTLNVGLNGNGTVNLTGGSVLTTGGITRTGTGVGTVNFNGGTLQASNNSASFITNFSSGNLVLQSGGGTINTQGYNVTLTSPISGTGSLIKQGTGTLIVGTKSNNSYTGATIVQAGTLQVQFSAFNNNLNATGISAYYPLNNPNNLLADASPNGNNLIDVYGTATYNASGPANSTQGSISFPNNNANIDYLTTPNGLAPGNFPLNNSSYTLAAWVNLDGTNLGANGIIGYGNYGNNRTVNALRTANSNASGNTVSPDQLDNYWWAADQVDTIPNSQTTNSLVNNWHYAAVTYNSSSDTRTIYLDGTVIGTDTPGANNASNANFAIGRTNTITAPTTEYFTGALSQVFVATSALTPSQLATLSTGNISFGTYAFQGTLAPGALAIAGGATVDLNGSSQIVGGLQNYNGGGGVLTNNNSNYSSALTVAPAGSNTFGGNIQDGTGTLSLIINGTGIQILTGINNYSGGTTITGGTLEISPTSSLPATGAVNVSGGTLLFDANTTGGYRNLLISNLTIGNNGTVALGIASQRANRSVLTLPGLSLTPTSKLDLGNNDLVVQNSNLTTITGLVATGYNNGNWNGPGGIVSAAAANDSRHLTALGVIVNNGLFGTGAPQGLFDGTSPGYNDILVKYTYYGDGNLDGKVDGSDYTLIDNGYLNHLTGWQNGDFNYDNVVDGSDYTLIDNAFNSQGASLAAEVSAIPTTEIAAGVSAVPEPTSMGLLTVSALGLLRRRRRIAIN